jgi:MFS family permease
MPQRMEAPEATAPLDVTAKKALAASTVRYAMDGYDFLMLAFILGAIGTELGLSPAQRRSLATWTLIGAVVGGIGFGILSDHYGRVRVLTCSTSMAKLIFVVAASLLLAELYPTEARATAENVLFNLGRGIGGFGPFVVGALVASYSFEVAIAALAVIYIIAIMTTYFLIPEKKGAALT